eukprot:696697-Hanusia_phi.AAC.1
MRRIYAERGGAIAHAGSTEQLRRKEPGGEEPLAHGESGDRDGSIRHAGAGRATASGLQRAAAAAVVPQQGLSSRCSVHVR